MLLTAISEAVERYDPEREAVVMIESEKGLGSYALTLARRRALSGSETAIN
jgi:hypothetical protein